MSSFALQGSSPNLQGSSPSLQGGSQSLQGSSPSLQGSNAILQGAGAIRQHLLGNSFIQSLMGGGEEDQEVDLTQYAWMAAIYVASEALDQAGADALLQSATAAQLEQAQAGQIEAADEAEAGGEAGGEVEADVEADAAAVPAADLASDDNNWARPLDWDRAPARGHMSPEAPAAEGHDATTETMDATFQQHRTELMAEDFGANVTLEQIRACISLAQILDQDTVAEHLQARLFRVNQYAVVSTLNVEDSGRYTPGGDTYCNIYAYDAVTALGAYIPRVWWYPAAIRRLEQGEEVQPIYAETVHELNANALNDWLDEWGAQFGWSEAADMRAAQDAANSGKVVIISAANADRGRSGHISVVLAERGDGAAQRHEDGAVEAPLQSQAGSTNFNADNNSRGLGRDQWWEDNNHTNGAAWINNGSGQSPILTPDDIGR